MKKALIISNITKRFQPGHLSMIDPLKELGYEVHWAANLHDYQGDIRLAPCNVHQIDFERNPFKVSNIKAYKQLNELLKEGFDVIHCQSPIGGMLGRICGNKARISKIIYTAHGFHFYKGASLINRTIIKTAEVVMARFTDAIITMNQEDFEEAQKMKLKKSGKVYKIHGIGVDTNAYHIEKFDKQDYRKLLGISAESTVLISMGDLIKRKNYETALKAISKLDVSNIDYIICGTGPEEKKIKKLAKDLNIEKSIHVLGFRTDIKELLNCSDIFLFTTYQEGLPRSMMEAMSTGLPCVASKIRGNTDLINDGYNGFLCDTDDINSFSNAINNLIYDKELKKIMKERNLKTIKKYDIENIKKEMKFIYKNEAL